MIKKILRTGFVLFAVAAFVASISSCNRGYGCPNNFSIDVEQPIILE